MLQFDAKKYIDPEKLASDYLNYFFQNETINYPINPFEMLSKEGILFSVRNFKKLEGVYIPSSGPQDDPIVGINGNRPITRQRYTAAHELCHHLHDSERKIICPIGDRTRIEDFANSFAAALLMPLAELKCQVSRRKDRYGNVSFDDILEIADYFGVSFEACAFGVAYRIHAIDGDIEAKALRKRIVQYNVTYSSSCF